MDDIFLFSDDVRGTAALLAESERIKVLLQEVKLEVVPHKCRFYAAAGVTVAPAEQSTVWANGMEVLGSAVGAAEFIRIFLAAKKEEEIKRLHDLKALHECDTPLNLQDCLLIARFSMSPLSRIGHLTRTIEPELSVECLGPLDDVFTSFVLDLIKVPIAYLFILLV